jgi:hypothetical protein
MAKQTFTTGQVLTAAQMTSLQQTAMGGGSATAKTASYVLTAADAGTTIIMNSGSATTITVNTALFAAGDTVFILNQGAGVCTITAGTATVTTVASLAMAQNETGQLYFLSTSAAIFTEYMQVAAASGSMTEIASGSLSTGTLTLNSISSSYKDLVLVIRDVYTSAATSLRVRLNNDTGSNYILTGTQTITTGGSNFLIGAKDTSMEISNTSLAAADNNNAARFEIYDYANATSGKLLRAQTSFTSNASGFVTTELNGGYIPATAITRIDFYIGTGTFSGGTYVLYGVN